MIQQVLIENENEMKLNKYREGKNHQSLQIIYFKWKQVANEHLRDRFLNQRSQRFYEIRLLRRYFSQWREQHHFDMRIKVKLSTKRNFISLNDRLVTRTTSNLV